MLAPFFKMLACPALTCAPPGKALGAGGGICA